MISPRPRLWALLALVLTATSACSESKFKGDSARLSPVVHRDFVQQSYPKAETRHTQGSLGAPATDGFDQGEWGKLDLLVVIDNSSSMQEEQVNLASKMAPLLSAVQRSDWQIAVVTTDPADGCQRALIKKSDPDATARFEAAINAGTGGYGEERGILQAVVGLKAECRQPWVRAGSTVSVLIVSDEDNCYLDQAHGGYGCQNQPDRYGDYLLDYLSSIRTPGKDARLYGLIWHPSAPSCGAALDQGVEYAKVIDATGGKWGAICDADYTPTLEAISRDIAQILKYELVLSADPDAGTLVVKVDGKEWTQYELEGRRVTFTEAPPFGAKVEAEYRSGGDGGPTNEMTLDKEPVAGSLVVTVNGEALDASAYHWDADKKALVFATAPAEKAEVVVDYKEAVALPSTFDIGLDVDPSTLQVVVDGKAVTSGVSYEAATGSVRVEPAPAEGAKITVSYKSKPKASR